MRGLKTMLFGIAVILVSGFLVVGQAVGFSPFSLGLFLGLLVSFLGLAMGDGDEGDGDESVRGGTDDPDGTNDPDGGANEKAAENDDSDEGDSFEPDHYSPNRFPPM